MGHSGGDRQDYENHDVHLSTVGAQVSNDIIVNCFEKAVSACSLQEYSCEEELQWFLAYLLKKATMMEIEREVRTQTTYYTNERGLLEIASNRVKGRRRSKGSVDIVCKGAQRSGRSRSSILQAKNKNCTMAKDSEGMRRSFAISKVVQDAICSP